MVKQSKNPTSKNAMELIEKFSSCGVKPLVRRKRWLVYIADDAAMRAGAQLGLFDQVVALRSEFLAVLLARGAIYQEPKPPAPGQKWELIEVA